MGEEVFDNSDVMRSVNCEECGRPVFIEIHIVRKNTDCYVWQEGICGECCHGVFIPLPEAAILLNDALKRAITN